ncbi:probable Putative DEAH-box ATP-dependent helicase UM11114 [Pseudozyma flocculosa]|uniref:RNA helicase n=1 Tax=Pseudozyma flocculosa TaxID=84751 RepID=A0A5C3F6R9_9BASI|nr:probable Putative DEAH-box ATP-dependent helicase UM11114 [Pseudozyma flocculosa]
MAPRKKNPAIKSSGSTSSKAAPLPDWVKGNAPKPPPSYTKAGREAAAAAAAAKSTSTPPPGKTSAAASSSTPPTAAAPADAKPTSAGPASSAAQQQPREMLFPPGSKTPLNMLYERIQKLPGWEKPIVEPRRHPNGYSCVVTLKKANKQDASNPHTVRFEPKEPGLRLDCQSSLEAKHWGATYALFRIFNNLSLNRALPPGPREYWQQLEAYKKQAPSHQDWMWEADPFDAQIKREAEKAKKEREREAAQQAAASGRNEIINGKLNGTGRSLSKAWQEAKEVRMGSSLREKVENTIRRLMTVFPEACTAPLNLDDDESPAEGPSRGGESAKPIAVDVAGLERELVSLGFRPGHARSAASWLASARKAIATAAASSSALPDPLLASAASLGDREAAIEYLMLYTPEDDLPTSFKPSKASESFITSASAGSGSEGLAITWAIDRLVKVGGYPREAVERVFRAILSAEKTSSQQLPRQAREGLALDMLNRQMAGWDQADVEPQWSSSSALRHALEDFPALSHDDQAEIQSKRDDERMAVEAVLGPERIAELADNERTAPGEYDIFIAGPKTHVGGKEDVRLRIKTHPHDAYPRPFEAGSGRLIALPSFFVASSTLPSYLRLALTLHLLEGIKDTAQRPDWQEMVISGEGGVVLALVEELEVAWMATVDDPPLLSKVMQHLVPSKSVQASAVATPDSSRPGTPSAKQSARGARGGPGANGKRGGRALQRSPEVDERLKDQQKRLHESAVFAKMGAVRRSLPAHAAMGDVLSMISRNRVIIIAGETGCGKTTQVPQFILDEAISSGQGSECNIVVTQPRRVSAMGVAARVAVERGEDLGGKASSVAPDSLVGYAIRPLGISHVIVDEVHERSVDSDFLLLELREVLKRNPKIKVVLMSATINQETFADYFAGAPCLEIPGRTFPVTDHYLEDIVRDSGFRPSPADSRSFRQQEGKRGEQAGSALRSQLEDQGMDEDHIQALEALSRSERINYDLVGATARYVIERAEKQEAGGQVERGVGGAILVFCPGVGEIRQAMDSIRSAVRGAVDIMPLHANLSPDEQRRVFLPPRAGHRKIVVSTNVAETSITIPDISYVIDTGRVKETRFEPESSLTRLVECWASRAACRQRRGRAGRVRAGECFRLYTRLTEECKMAPQQTPEMRRVPLESLFLEVKSMREDEDVKHYLGKAIDPPSVASMDTALKTLIEVGALQAGGGFKSRLTPLGRHLAQLPLDLRLGKLLILGTVFGCLGPMLTVASVMSCKPLFNAPFDKRAEMSKARAAFAMDGCKSDLLTDANAWHQWNQMRIDKRPNSEMRAFCEDNFLSPSTLRDILATRHDLLSHLQELNFVAADYKANAPSSAAVHAHDAHSTNGGMLRSLIMAGLWPSVVRIALPSAKFDQGSSGTIQRDAEAKAVKYFDPAQGRVFLFPGSTLFEANSFASSYLAVFKRSATDGGGGKGPSAAGGKVYLRDATESPVYALLLFGGRLKVHHYAGGISIGSVDGPGDAEGFVKLRANARIGVLCAQLRRLVDAILAESVENPGKVLEGEAKEVVECIVALVERDGI